MTLLGWILVRLLINAGALLLVSRFISGFEVANWQVALIAALLLGIVNAVIRPILAILTLPITILTLGLFSFVLTAAMLLLVASVVDGFAIRGFASALIGAVILWVVSVITNALLHSD
jgi:putative membrane protein